MSIPRPTRVEIGTLPEFSPAGYSHLLNALSAAGYALRPVDDIAEPAAPVAFLRHDIDIHIRGIDEIGRREADVGASATYFVALTQPYNPAYPSNRAVLRELVRQGHRIGLHYDLTTYPPEHDAAREHLLAEISSLEDLVESTVRTICMHNPWEGEPDLFAAEGPHGVLNPHAATFAAVRYISDSCRAWRDEALLECLRAPEAANVMISTHPELWLGDPGEDRHTFLGGALLKAATDDLREFLFEEVQPSWRRHPGARQHDLRGSAAGSPNR